MPVLSYKCENCDHSFEYLHLKINDKLTECPECQTNSLKTIIPKSFSFNMPGGTESMANHGYTGRHKKLVKNLKGNKNYRDGYRDEREQQERIGLKNYKEEEKMLDAQEQFAKMREEGMRMTKEEKEAIKKEFGIDADFAKEIRNKKK